MLYLRGVAVALTWNEAARLPGVIRYYEFRGTFNRGTEAAPVLEPFAWATVPINKDGELLGGMVEGRIVALGKISRGFPEVVGGAPERVNTSITLDDTDGALSTYFRGGNTPETEYTLASFLNLRGKLYAGLVDPTTGERVEQAITPTLVVAGAPRRVNRQITLRLASWDEPIFPQVRDLVRVSALVNATPVADGEAQGAVRSGSPTGYPMADWMRDSGEFVESLDTIVPYAYGRPTLLPIRVSAAGASRILWVAYVGRNKATLFRLTEWGFFFGSVGDKSTNANPLQVRQIQVSTTNIHGESVALWVTIVAVDTEDHANPNGELARAQRAILERVDTGDPLIVVPSSRSRVGVPQAAAVPGTPSPINPASLIERVILDHSRAGSSGIHTASFARTKAAMDAAAGQVGLTIAGAENLVDTVTAFARPFGLSLWVDTSDRLRCLPANAWGTEEFTEAANASSVTEIKAADIFSEFAEEIPVEGEARGAAVAHLAIDWPGEVAEVWPADQMPTYAPGGVRLPLSQEAKASIPGRVIYPPAASDALADASARRNWPTRRWNFLVELHTAADRFGELVRVTHPDGAQIGGYVRRLGRIERAELDPVTHMATVTVEDLGPVEFIKVGVLDSWQHWICADPGELNGAGGCNLLFYPGDGRIEIDGDPLPIPEEWKEPSGMLSLWTYGALEPANRRSFRIEYFETNSEGKAIAVHVRESPEEGGMAPCNAAGQNGPLGGWVVMHTHTSMPGHRIDKIRLCYEPSAQFSDGDQGYRYSGG